ncbi:glycosyltransferase family 4 protein [Sphingomonas qomolangmaensis]|uniref:Glycosyltransferase family 4 protein n=1 Tax=Sphingomonas qomolangmaensis TaxID=2918765 RepID=A0ABY5L7P5_9SPHN|nr:glycosyltransferase family 4 protein [Sphingomonas qomolangmaensis]UUL82462.1 glycosyltransferase family 4 protein [Sphingomonas qomolangmaensis]
MAKILLSVNAAWNIVNFRAALVRALIADGHELVAAVVDDGHLAQVESLGVRTIALPMAPRGVSPVADAILLWRYVALMRRERPGAFLGWTIKPNIYGGLAAGLTGVPAINNISGLGTAFIRSNWLTRLVRRLYRAGLRRSSTVFFQNRHDRDLFVEYRIVDPGKAELLPGSGIDVDHFDPARFDPPPAPPFRFLLIARLIRDKGVLEYVEAARSVQAAHPDVACEIMGFLDVVNPTAISRATVEGWVSEGVIAYRGASPDVRPAIAAADCIVLPSYREGMSHVLLEAAAMAKPAITTRVPGCADIVRDGVTGLLCEPRSAADLATKMRAMIALSQPEREMMGNAARTLVTASFSEGEVIRLYRDAIARSLRQ